MHSIAARAFFPQIPIVAKGIHVGSIGIHGNLAIKAGEKDRLYSQRRVRRETEKDGEREGGGETGAQHTPSVITTATTESFVCVLLPQSIVA